MSRPAGIDRSVFVSLALACVSAAWWGCDTSPVGPSTSSSTGSGGVAGGGTGGTTLTVDGGGGEGGGVDAGVCTSTSAAAHRIPLDIIFLIDRSGSMDYDGKWEGTKAALTAFFNDPASAGIGAGLVFFPSPKGAICESVTYETLDVPIGPLPTNAFALTNTFTVHAWGWGTPTYAAATGTLMAATAYQDAHPDHKVVMVLATDGDPYACGDWTMDDVAEVVKAARNYNGVLTFVIAVDGSVITNVNKLAAAGGTGSAYDITQDIDQFSAKMAEIRGVALGCDFAIPPPPAGLQLDPNKVNFSYTPKGVGSPKILPRADDLADCNGQPGWYYDSNSAPTKIILCPASCTTVQADSAATVSVLFGCKSVPN